MQRYLNLNDSRRSVWERLQLHQYSSGVPQRRPPVKITNDKTNLKIKWSRKQLLKCHRKIKSMQKAILIQI